MSNRTHGGLILLLLLAAVLPCQAARIGEISQSSLTQQALRFFTLADPSVRYALIGSVLLGITSGLLGSFLVVRKMALVGDALSHAVLPGVALGFLWSTSKDPVAILIGATLAGLLGTAMVSLLTHTTRLKEDTALGMVLAAFFSVGICMVTMIQRLPTGNKSGIDKFLFGQAAAIRHEDVQLMGAVTGLTVVVIFLLYKEFLVTSFDQGFARAIGFPVRLLHHLLMLLLAFSVVIALQAVGVVLVSAMLITPAATAYLLTDRMHRMLLWSALFGMLAGMAGAFLSFLGPSLPTGPFMVLGATAIFALAFLLAPRHGVVARWWRQRSQSNRIQRENTLKAVYQVAEQTLFATEGVSLEDLARRRRVSLEEIGLDTRRLLNHGLATRDEKSQVIYLTPEGWTQARAIVRNHRLWELYLTHAAQFSVDQVHDDAEKIEHVLGDEVVRELEKRLEFATHDPHGRPIPYSNDPHQPDSAPRSNRVPGFGQAP